MVDGSAVVGSVVEAVVAGWVAGGPVVVGWVVDGVDVVDRSVVVGWVVETGGVVVEVVGVDVVVVTEAAVVGAAVVTWRATVDRKALEPAVAVLAGSEDEAKRLASKFGGVSAPVASALGTDACCSDSGWVSALSVAKETRSDWIVVPWSIERTQVPRPSAATPRTIRPKAIKLVRSRDVTLTANPPHIASACRVTSEFTRPPPIERLAGDQILAMQPGP